MLEDAQEGWEGALYIGERRGCFGLRRWTPVHGARRRAASVRGGEGDGGHAATVGEWRRAQDQEDGDEHSALRTVGLAGPCPCSLRRAPASAIARGKLMALRQGWWRSLARSGRRGKRARAKQSARRHSERVDTQAGIVYTRGHRVNFALRPTYVQSSCLACCSW